MACGTPVIITDCKGVRDFVVHEKNALMVPAKEPEAIAESIINMYNNPDLANKLKEEGILTAKKFTWEELLMFLKRISKIHWINK